MKNGSLGLGLGLGLGTDSLALGLGLDKKVLFTRLVIQHDLTMYCLLS